jgi:hypothetical protein
LESARAASLRTGSSLPDQCDRRNDEDRCEAEFAHAHGEAILTQVV